MNNIHMVLGCSASTGGGGRGIEFSNGTYQHRKPIHGLSVMQEEEAQLQQHVVQSKSSSYILVLDCKLVNKTRNCCSRHYYCRTHHHQQQRSLFFFSLSLSFFFFFTLLHKTPPPPPKKNPPTHTHTGKKNTKKTTTTTEI